MQELLVLPGAHRYSGTTVSRTRARAGDRSRDFVGDPTALETARGRRALAVRGG
ncbi:hypothetical protein DB32_006345 [Sandaracinus amylolyticus]|uniref:Uncharacterized protein n=1 Tax=Sandaracinus amylolyticus TaxID=927083 RepID=A0A0F6W7F8_9BACT|nr:hypothetical protein DB32_006345 [Sandaracinus amylolyticus]